MEEETVSASKPNPLEGVEERTQHWLLARSNLTEDGTLVYKKKEVVAVQEKTLQVAAKQRPGLFKSDRKNDQLNAALGNPEHTGRSAALVLKCRGNMVFQKTLPAIRSVICTRKHLKRRFKRRFTRSLRKGLRRSYKILANKKVHHCSIS
jgi:hypothetical protein